MSRDAELYDTLAAHIDDSDVLLGLVAELVEIGILDNEYLQCLTAATAEPEADDSPRFTAVKINGKWYTLDNEKAPERVGTEWLCLEEAEEQADAFNTGRDDPAHYAWEPVHVM